MVPLINTCVVTVPAKLSVWKHNNGYSSYPVLSDVAIARLLEELGVSMYLEDVPCHRNFTPYYPRLDNGWNKVCSLDITLHYLPAEAACYIPSTCSGVECCIDVNLVRRSFHVYTMLDECNSVLTVGIEKLKFNISLQDFKWDKINKFYLHGVIKIDYLLQDLPSQKLFIFNLNVSVCFDSMYCEKTVRIFQDTILPKMPSECDWNSGFAISDFSYQIWRDSHGIKPGDVLNPALLSELTDDLAVAPFFVDEACHHNSSGERWINDCGSNISLPALPDTISCQIPNLCTGVQCCLSDGILQRPISVSVLIDSCNQQMTMAVEKFSISVSLFNYEWDFSLTQWLSGKGTDVNTSLSEPVLRQLYKDLKLYKFFDGTPCNGSLSPYGPTPDGWNTTCPANLTTKALNDSIACHIPEYCTGIDCCINVNLLQRSFRTYLFLDACDFKLTVGIEKRKFEVLLFGYQWGSPEEFDLNGVIHAEFSVYRNLATKSYSFSLVLKVCFEAGGNCLKTINVLENTAIPMQKCTYGPQFKVPGFSLNNWLLTKGLSSTSTLSDIMLDTLIDNLGLTSYLQQSCNRSASPFYPSSDGWNKSISRLNILYIFKFIFVEGAYSVEHDCLFIYLFLIPFYCSNGITAHTALPDSLACHMSDSCAHLLCCVDVPILQRSLQAGFELDICNYMIYVRLEKMEISTSLLNYEWGTEKTITIHNVIGIKYIINNEQMEKKLKVDVWLKLCLDTTCLVDTQLLKSAEYEYPICNNTKSNVTQGRLPFPGLTLDFWNPKECSLPATIDCKDNKMPDILKSICAFTPDCQTVTCCMKLDFIPGSRHIQVNVGINNCTDNLTYGIENKQWSKSLSGFSSTVFNVSESVADSFGLSLEVTDMATMYQLNMSIKACGLATDAEGGGCQTYMLLVDTYINKQACAISTRRRKRQTSSGDSFIEGLKKLASSGASDSEINTYVEQYQQKEAERRQQNLGGYDSTNPKEEMGYSSTVKALGDRNPATIEFVRSPSAHFEVTIQGGDAISNMIGKGNDIVGRANQLFIVGQGLTGAGVKLLGNQLANMTIGDLESMLEVNKIDPLKILQLGKDLRDLAKALYSEFIKKLFNGELLNAFKSFDVSFSGSFPFPRQTIELFKVQTSFFLGGFIHLTFEFGAGGYYGVDFTLTAHLMSMKGEAKVVPYGGLKVWGEVGIGFLLYGKLQIVGYIMDTRFPTTADIIFNKFPLNVALKMDLELRPFRLVLNGLVTLEVNLLFVHFKKTLYKHKLWEFSVPPITKRLIDVGRPAEDTSPPEFGNILNSPSGKEKRSAMPVCEVQQLKHRDYTEPAFEIAVHAVDDKSQVKFFLDIGTVPGGNDVMKNQPLGGATTTVEQFPTSNKQTVTGERPPMLHHKLSPSGVPLYFTMYAENSAGARSSVACRLETYDVTIPGGRFSADFITSSNPTTLKASVLVVDDSKLEKIQVGVGFGKGIFGDQMVTWTDINLVKRTSSVHTGNDPMNLHTLEHFTGMKNGKLMGPKFKVYEKITTAGDCARKCMDFPETKCMSFNFDYGPSGTCELLEAIEGLDYKIFQSGLFCHYERLGIGHAVEFSYEDLMLEHNGYYYFNLELINELGYKNFISTKGILVDFTPPEPGLIKNGSKDYTEIVPCLENIPKDRPDWNMYCIGVSNSVKNHRIIIDGPGSRTVFNGDKPMQDILYTRINNFVSANWDGIHDKETGLLGYSWTVGTKVCEELIHPHHDPHKHLLDKSQWTNSGQIYPLPAPYTTLPDGTYYITVRALNNVQYGGPLATTICHTTPYIVDTSPPFVYEIFNIKYNEDTFLIYAEHNTSDPDSGIAQLDLCLGQSTRDCNLMEWQRYPYGPNITHTFEIPNGIPAWIKVRAINNVDLRTEGHADQAIIVDITPPEAGTVYDGPIYKTDLMFTKDKDQICSNWLNFFDPESGIGKYAVGVGTKQGLTDIANLTLVEQYVHETCLALQDDKQLQHGHKYFTVVWAYNRAIKQRNVSAVSDGVIVDLTKPEVGEVADGNRTGFKDVQFSSAESTVDLQWQGFHDPESHIRQYDVQILRLPHDGSEWEVLKNWTTFKNDTNAASWKNFHLHHKDRVKSTVRAVNGALNPVERDTDGFIVDLTPPNLLYLGDGNNDKSDIEFQVNNSALSVNFKFVDDESGLDHYKIQVYELKEGSRHQIYPAHDGSWVELKNDTSITSYTQTGLHLSAGAHYSLRVGAVNQAGFVAAYDTNGVIVDNTPPVIHWIHVGVMAGEDEDVVEGFVYQSDHTGIKISWFTSDHESGIEGAMIAVGTNKGESSILDWTYLEGDLRDYYIENLNLQTTNETEKSPVYYVSIKTKNGAEQYSTVLTSHAIVVLPEDVTGIVTDGPSFGIEYDIDYQSDMSTITVAFSGFESSQHGIMGFEWAIGTLAGGEDVQPYMDTGIVHTETDSMAGNGVASSGFAQAVVSLEHGSQYYTSIRAVTNAGKILEAMTDGVMVDVTPPKITIDSLSDVEFIGNESDQVLTLYQRSTDSLTARWHYNDTELLENDILDNIDDAWFSVGTYPFGDDIWNVTDMAVSTNLDASLPIGLIHPESSGKPNLLNIWARNSAGLTGKIASASVVVDQTPPINGQVNCPSFAKQHTPIKCNWTGFFDKESPITMYTVTMGTKEGLNDVVSPIEIAGDMDQYAFKATDMKSEAKHGDIYYATVTATNKVGLQSYSFSASIKVDTTPPISGQVVELYDEYRVDTMNDTATVLMNLRACKTSDECSAIDATCQESFTTVSVTWQPFLDPESGIVQYEIAVGTSPGGAQIKPFFEIPLGNNYIIHGLDLKGMKQVFVTVKGVNGAGMSTVSTSNGIYLSYLSQGEKPPKLGGVWDDDPHSFADIEYQTDRTTLYARWDVSGDPCPAVKYEWAIERLDGYRVQDFVDTFGTTHGVNDQLQMKNGERYYSLLRVTNALGYQYTIRSDGVTIHEHPLVPGQVYDGDVFGYDLNIMKTKSKATANWEGFGVPRDAIKKVDILTGNAGVQVDDITPSKDQEIEYYEVALGTDRRFKKTRDDVVPFTKVGRNTSVTFWDLDLVPGFAMYYFTVRAYSASYSMSEVTSNGFYVAFDGGVTAGKIVMPDFVPADKNLDVNWEGFTSKVDILMYYVALSNNSLANGTSCKRYIDGGRATEEEKNKLFSVFGVTNVGTNTLYRFSNILLKQGATYFAWVMGADKAGECNMTVHQVTIDVTPPTMGKIRSGPYYDMPVSYTMSNSSIHAYWQGFHDMESSIDHYEISLWQNSTCDRQTSTQSLIIPEIKLSSNYTDYALVELNLTHSVPYIIKLTAVNKAGLSVNVQTTPVLHDASVPLPGHVGEGLDFIKDVVWWGSDVEVNGVLLQLQNPYGPSCPSRHSSFKDKMTWKALNLYGFRDKSEIDWNIQYREANILINNLTDEMTIKLARDTKSEHMFSGGYFGSADMENGGDYELSIKAADGNGKAVTEIMFLDGDMSLLDTLHFMEGPDWTADVCSCCLNTPVPISCTCNCSSYLEAKSYYANLTYSLTGENQTTVTPMTTVATTTDTISTVPWIKLDDKVKQQLKHNNTNINIPSHVTQRACGFQIYTGPEPYSVVWCRFYNDSSYPLSLKTTLPFNPAEEFHQYKISFSTVKEELKASWCLNVYTDGQKLSQLCGVPQFTTDTKLLLHVWNRDNFLPALGDLFQTWTVRALFRDLILPPEVGALCRYGEPFRGGTNSIVRYEAGIGAQNGLADFADFREVLSPCLPCSDTCSHYVCDPACDGNTDTLLHFTLKDLYLEPEINVDTENGTDIVPAVYYITVKAVLGSGAITTASSNGFYVDLTPPIFDPDVMLYIDVRQGEFTPTHFQSSNDTIKSVWLCRDNQSDVEEYHWAIGTTPGGSELQSFISTGINPTGINSNLSGILEHNTTYYVSVKCRNQAGITTVWNDTKGVTVLLEPPDVDKVNASIEGAKQFDHAVEPKDAMTTSDPTTIGCSWEVSPDPSVTRYDYCVGSSRDVIDDIFPCTWVGLNVSGTVAIKGGNLTISGIPVRRLSELKPLGNDFNDTKYKTDAENIFHMEPGRTMFITMRLCNEANLCKNKFLGSVVVQTPSMKVATSTDGSPIEVKLDAGRGKKYRRSVDVIDIQTPSGLNPGQSLITAVLENNDLTTQYRSDASMDFVPYIVNPNDTMDLVERKLARRLKEIYTVFTVVPVGHMSLPGPLVITFDNSNANISGDDSVITLLHWNPDAQLWQISSGSCQDLNETETTDFITGKASVKVCDTRLHDKNVTKARFQRDTSHTDHGMLSRETMFATARVKAGIVNDAPVLNCTTHVVIKEDQGVLYDLKAYDPEGDKVIYKISPSQLPVPGEMMITPDGSFTYMPCKDCSGNITFSISLEDHPSAADIPSASSTFLLTVEVEEENDPPMVFLYDADGQNMLHQDPTNPVIIYHEQLKVNESLSFTAVFGAFDIDFGDALTLHKNSSAHGNFSIETLLANFTDKFKTCDRAFEPMCPDVNSALNRSKMTWMAVKITYHLDSPYIGLDNLTFRVTDNNSTSSDIVTLQMALMAQPCLHNGGCRSKHPDRYECEDIRRTESFDLYYTCDCHEGWTGLRCEDDIDECVGNPCAEPMICLNLQNHFQCACPPDQTNCLPAPEEEFKWWMGALVAVGCLLLIGIVIVCCLYKTGRLMAWKRSAYNAMAKIKNGSKVSIMSDETDDSVNKSEDRVENIEESIDVEEENGRTSVLEVSGVDINADIPKIDFGFAPGVFRPPHHRIKTRTTHN
ncbi:hypothetical protein CHS0354_024514 [Potamilus streckersoni]|uniref:Uncharacterized protein n=1 Tax=Potamilus streckersoni TaxID=2493646 RepID=A0AAE0TLJ6_9BIVA|nr:hypothetical protein CHS0354_024514 [Potamilus streckersoni]